MNQSTPLIHRDLRRSLLQSTVDVSPLRRSRHQPSPIVSEKPPNDENERSTRRSLADIQRRVSNIPQGNTILDESRKFLGEQDMQDHFQICTKLFSENKITSKNVWQLHIIDILKDVAKKSNDDTLQIATTTLDISAKVYSVRVDDIHAAGMKLASSMARVAEKETSAAGGDSDNGQEDADEQNTKRASKKKRKFRLRAGEKPTISKNPASLLGSLPKLPSVFFSNRTNAEASAVDNLFTNVLPMDNTGYKFLLLSNDKFWCTDPDPLVSGQNKDKKFGMQIKDLTNFKICSSFADFRIDEWNPDEEEKQIAADKSLIRQKENEVMFDENGIPIAELDGSVHDIFSNNDNDFDDVMDGAIAADTAEENFIAPQIRGDIIEITDFRQNKVQSYRSDYSYNTIINTHSGNIVDQIWAGPSHWKFKFIRRQPLRFSGSVVVEKSAKKKGGRKKKSPEPVDFDEDIESKYDMNNFIAPNKRSHIVDPSKITLPLLDPSNEDMLKRRYELMSKPGLELIRKTPNTNQNDVDYEISNYKYENPNDSQYCSQQKVNDGEDIPMAGDDDHCDNDNDQFDECEIATAAQKNFLAENLIDAPEIVSKSYVPYALQAKKMDMKKLKWAVWKNLTGNVEDSEIVCPTTFSKMYKEIPAAMPEKMREELSSSLAFVALLHVANEKCLKLIQHVDYKDFDILG